MKRTLVKLGKSSGNVNLKKKEQVKIAKVRAIQAGSDGKYYISSSEIGSANRGLEIDSGKGEKELIALEGKDIFIKANYGMILTIMVETNSLEVDRSIREDARNGYDKGPDYQEYYDVAAGLGTNIPQEGIELRMISVIDEIINEYIQTDEENQEFKDKKFGTVDGLEISTEMEIQDLETLFEELLDERVQQLIQV